MGMFVPQAYANSVVSSSPSSTLTLPVISEPIVYVLPYPGLLPTHPLYFIKNLRDKMIELLITDTISKAEFYILQADKKLNMGIVLRDMDKNADANMAFADAFTLRTRAIVLLESSKVSLPGYLVEKVFLSLDKHIEVVRSAGKKVDALTALRVRAEKSLKRVL